MPTEHLILFSSILFCLGLLIVITKKNAIVVLMGIELMLNAANLNLITGSALHEATDGQFLVLFVILVAAAEVSVGLAIVIKLYQYYRTADLNEINRLKG